MARYIAQIRLQADIGEYPDLVSIFSQAHSRWGGKLDDSVYLIDIGTGSKQDYQKLINLHIKNGDSIELIEYTEERERWVLNTYQEAPHIWGNSPFFRMN